MSALTREKLYSLEEYAEKRPQIRKNVIATKKIRNVHLGDHVLFMFENVETIQYQIQEMLRIEKIFESEGIQEELDVYNPLIPDGNNLKATLMIEYDDVEERRKALAKLIGIEKKFTSRSMAAIKFIQFAMKIWIEKPKKRHHLSTLHGLSLVTR
jgi:hypothetical protein